MHRMTKEAIKKLQTETAHVITVEDFDLIEELDAIASGINGTTKQERRLLSQPYNLCGINFYPITVAKSLWFAEKVKEWELQDTRQGALLFWLLSLPNVDGKLDGYSEQKAVDRAVKKLNRRLHCTNQELSDVYLKCIGSTGESGSDSDPDYGGMIAVLLREYGGTPDRWLYETPVTMIATLFDAYSRKVDAENRSVKGASAKNSKAIAPPPSKRLKALAKFRKKINEIKEIWSECHGA